MMLKVAELSRLVVARIEAEPSGLAAFDAHELDRYPPAAIAALVGQRVLVETARAKSIFCPGCELACHKQVVLRSRKGGIAAFIVCDEAPDLGRISVPDNLLKKYQVSWVGICRLVARKLQLEEPTRLPPDTIVDLGSVKGRYGPRRVSIRRIDDKLMLLVGTQRERLYHILIWDQDNLSIDKAALRRMANRKEREELPERQRSSRAKAIADRNREILNRGIALRDQGLPVAAAAERIATMSFIVRPAKGLKPISSGTIRRLLTDLLDT